MADAGASSVVAGLVGFARVADFIACDKEHSAALYKSYERLAARNLLYMQSEIRDLQSRFDDLDHDDVALGEEGVGAAMSWPLDLEDSDEVLRNQNLKRFGLVQELRGKIKEYQEAVLRNEEMLQLRRPTKQVHDAFKSVFHNVDSKDAYSSLLGLSADLYDNRQDLVSLMQQQDDDRLTRLLRERCPRLFKRSHISSAENIESLSESRLQVFVGAVNLLVASVILFGAVYALYYVKEVEKRLALVAGFTIIFALCIGLLTNARRPEIFAACAAYAAVLVVFVSGNLNNQQ